MKRLALVLGLLIVGAAGVYAQTDTFLIQAHITAVSKSVLIVEESTDTYSAVNQTVGYSSITVTNNSGGYTEDYQIKASTGLGNWILSDDVDPGPDEAVLYAVVKQQGSTSCTFGSEDVVTWDYQPCSTTLFGDGGDCGANVSYGTNATRSLLLQLKTPTSINETDENITLTINVM